MEVESLVAKLCNLIRADDAAQVSEILESNSQLMSYRHGGLTWLHEAAHAKSHRTAKHLIESGANVDAGELNSPWSTPVFCALVEDDPQMLELLLEGGAKPVNGKVGYLLSACTERKKNSLQMIQLLEKYGADLHETSPARDGKSKINALKRAMMAGKQDVVDYLRSRGCVLPEETPQPVEVATAKSEAVEVTSLADEIVAYFEKHFGPVDARTLIEIVPTEPPITVHAIPAGSGRKCITLFTTGLSAHAMNVPKESADYYAEDFRFAELFIQLPANWKYMQIADLNWGWPTHWLRSMAQFPYQNDSWLNGPFSIVSNGEPPEPLAPNTRFDSLLLLNETRFPTKDGRTIQLYRLLPLYPEERELEANQDIGALLRKFDELSLPFVVDLKRKNAAK